MASGSRGICEGAERERRGSGEGECGGRKFFVRVTGGFWDVG